MTNSRAPLSVTLITFNEEKNIRRALSSVLFASEIILVDSGSTDQTLSIAKDFGVRIVQRPWSGYGPQKNFAQSLCTQPWVLNIDADEEIPAPLAQEIISITTAPENHLQPAGYQIPRKTYFCGRWIKHGGWYPNLTTRLSRREKSRWTEPTVHESLRIDGIVGTLSSPMNHYTFATISDQVRTNLRYSEQGTQDLILKGTKPSIALLVLKPLGKWLETYIWKRGFLDGLAGWIISFNAAHSIFLKYARLFEDDLKKGRPS